MVENPQSMPLNTTVIRSVLPTDPGMGPGCKTNTSGDPGSSLDGFLQEAFLPHHLGTSRQEVLSLTGSTQWSTSFITSRPDLTPASCYCQGEEITAAVLAINISHSLNVPVTVTSHGCLFDNRQIASNVETFYNHVMSNVHFFGMPDTIMNGIHS